MARRMIPRQARHTEYLAVSNVAPAIRMVVVEAAADLPGDGEPGERWHQIHPVLALQSVIRRDYERDLERGGVGSLTTHRELLEAGWRHQGAWLHNDALVYDDHTKAVVSAAEMCLDATNVVYELVPAPWPPEEDESRLAEVIARLEGEAAEKAERNARMEERRRLEEAAHG